MAGQVGRGAALRSRQGANGRWNHFDGLVIEGEAVVISRRSPANDDRQEAGPRPREAFRPASPGGVPLSPRAARAVATLARLLALAYAFVLRSTRRIRRMGIRRFPNA